MNGVLLNEPDGFPAPAVERLSRLGPVYRADRDYPARVVTAAFVRLRERVGEDFHRRHPALRYLVSPTTGTDHLDLAYLERAGIEVITLRGRTSFLEQIHATAEHTLALVLALIRRVPAAAADVASGHWNRYPFKGSELFGKTVLLLGYGRVGRQVHALYQAFGCRVIAHDADIAKVPAELVCRWPDALAGVDVLSVHVALDTNSRGFVDAAILDRLPTHAVLVNTARGEVVDQDAVIQRVLQGRLGGAALDVLAGEPQPLSPTLLQQIEKAGPRLLLTPHIAGFTAESLSVVENHVADLLIDALGRF